MTRKLLLAFVISLCLSFPLLQAVFGNGGFLHNKALRQEIERLQYAQEVLSLRVQSLERQREMMSSSDALKDAAFKYGYQTEGEAVFYFDPSLREAEVLRSVDTLPVATNPTFKGIAVGWIFLMALAFSGLITLCYALIAHKRRERRWIG